MTTCIIAPTAQAPFQNAPVVSEISRSMNKRRTDNIINLCKQTSCVFIVREKKPHTSARTSCLYSTCDSHLYASTSSKTLKSKLINCTSDCAAIFISFIPLITDGADDSGADCFFDHLINQIHKRPMML